uniref:Uncharacterized protein n=1 Tax=Panagrellus redivivus TaxID=6233 RepID=A0A7E4V322_PANRE
MLRHCVQRRDCRQPHIRLPRPDPLRHTPPAALLLPRLAGAPSTPSSIGVLPAKGIVVGHPTVPSTSVSPSLRAGLIHDQDRLDSTDIFHCFDFN